MTFIPWLKYLIANSVQKHGNGALRFNFTPKNSIIFYLLKNEQISAPARAAKPNNSLPVRNQICRGKKEQRILTRRTPYRSPAGNKLVTACSKDYIGYLKFYAIVRYRVF